MQLSRRSFFVNVQAFSGGTLFCSLIACSNGNTNQRAKAGESAAGEKDSQLGVVSAINGNSAIAPDTFAFKQKGRGAVERTIESKLRDLVSVVDFGAVGDGKSDDTAAFQAAIDASPCVLVPPGVYKLTKTLVFRSGDRSLIGAGRGVTTIFGQYDGDLIEVKPANPREDEAILGTVTIRDMSLQKRDINSSVIKAHRARVDLLCLDIQGGFYGIQLIAVLQQCIVDNCAVKPGSYYNSKVEDSAGILVGRGEVKGEEDHHCNDVKIVNCEIASSPNKELRAHGILVHGCDGLFVSDCYIGWHAVSQLTMTDSSCSEPAEQKVTCVGVMVNNIYFDPSPDVGQRCVWLRDTGKKTTFKNISFTNCRFGGGTLKCVTIDGAISQVRFNGCDFRSDRNVCLNVNNGASDIIVDSCFISKCDDFSGAFTSHVQLVSATQLKQ